MSCKFLFTMSIDEIEEYLEMLWKQLCIKNSYINIFNSQKNNFNNIEELVDFLILEIENLKKFEDIMIKLSKEIESRERNINQIKNLCEKMNENNEEDNSNINNKKIMDDFFNSIISYRVHSIKVVEYYLLFKEKIIQGNSIEKFDEENLMKKYGLIKNGCNYLIKMKNDMNFINNSKIINNRENIDIFNSFRGDPFLTSLYNIIPVSREYKQRIKYCHYYIIQETINDNIMKSNTINNNKLINLNNNLNGLNDYRNYKKKKLEPIVNHSNYKENTQININTNINQTNINKNKDNCEFDFSKKYNKSVINSNKNDLDNYNEISKNNKIKEKENKKTFNYNDDDMVNIQNKENNNENDTINKININKIEIYNNKDNYEDINNNININYEKEKQNKINNKDTIKKEENILKNSLTISKKMKNKKENSRSVTPESKKLTNVVPSENISNINNVNTSIILDNDNIKLKKYNTSYYCGSLSDFITIYNNYYQRIPIEQKRIFNIKENPLNYFKNNYFPKIIISSDTKLTLIKGICIYSHIFNNSENKSNKIIIEHLSTYNNEEMENIFKNIFDFLKNNNILINSKINNVSNEIYIDLYFYLENGKFVIDTKIRDFIKNELKFKWVKLENLSEKIRYQKMKHLFNNNNNLLNNEIDDNNILNQSILGIKALKNEGEKNRVSDESEDNTIEENCDNTLFCNFCIKNKSVIKYINQKDFNAEKRNNNELVINNIKYINPFNFIYLIKKISEDSIFSEYIINNTYNFFTMNDHLDIEEILNNNDGVSLNDILSNNSFISSDIQKLINHFNDNKNKEGNNKFDINLKINIFPLFDNCISVKYNNYFFNRIEHDNIKILMEKETQQKFFFISPNNNKTDNIILLISSTLNEQFKNKYISPQNNSNINLKFIDIYKNIISSESNENENNKKYLYIPSFDINSKIKNIYKKHRKPENEEEFDNNNETYIINEYEEYFNIKFLSEDFIGESIKYKNKKNKNSSINFYFNEIEKDYIKNKDCVIDDNFIIFILNFDIIDNFAAIPLMSLYITKDNFISEY